MNLRVYYKYLSSRIASKWTVLFIDLLIVLISILLSYALNSKISSPTYPVHLYVWMGVLATVCCAIFFGVFHTYVGIIRFSSFVDIYRVLVCLTVSYGLLGLGNLAWSALGMGQTLPNHVLFLAYVFTFSMMVCLRGVVKMFYEAITFDARHGVNVFIYGFHGSEVDVAKSLRVSRYNHYRLRGFISDEPDMIGKHTMGCRVYANDKYLLDHLKRKNVQTIIVSSGKEAEIEKSGVMDALLSRGIQVLTLPPLSDCMDDGVMKDIHIEDWLRREPVQVDIRQIASHIEGHKIMVIGAAGFVGREVIRQVAALNPYQLILVDQAESPLYDVQLELSDDWKNLDVRVLVADVANRTRMESIFKEVSPQVVFHAAAYKNKQLMEDFVSEAIQTNIQGTINVVELALKYNVKRCVLLSNNKEDKQESVVDTTMRVAEIAALALVSKIKETEDKRLMIARLGEVYPCSPRSLITMAEASLLILEICIKGENLGIYLPGDICESGMVQTWHPKIMRCKTEEYDYERIYEKIVDLVQESYVQSQAALRFRINSFSETS